MFSFFLLIFSLHSRGKFILPRPAKFVITLDFEVKIKMSKWEWSKKTADNEIVEYYKESRKVAVKVLIQKSLPGTQDFSLNLNVKSGRRYWEYLQEQVFAKMVENELLKNLFSIKCELFIFDKTTQCSVSRHIQTCFQHFGFHSFSTFF